MKKMIIAVALACAAALTQAATVDWKVTSASTLAGKTVMAFDGADYSTVMAALTAGGTDIATTISGYSLGTGTQSGTGSRLAISGNAIYSQGATASDLFLIVFNGDVADGNTFYASETYNVSALAYEAGSPSKGTFSQTAAATFTGSEMSIGQSVPEPTSGLLLLLGMAGLALRRKQA